MRKKRKTKPQGEKPVRPVPSPEGVKTGGKRQTTYFPPGLAGSQIG